MGSENEQYSRYSRGSSLERADLQLNSGNFGPGMEKMSGFSFADLQKSNGRYQQMDLFQRFEEQVGNVVAAEAAIKHIAPLGYAVPEKVINDILRTGGGRDNNKKRIYAKYIVVRQIKSTTIRHFILTGIAEKRSNKAYYKHLIRQIK
ncbi:MAG: hypothetical protein PHX08_22865 [Lachnospiraceae bacterium]|nr:hypothetical protein [Lachnospiraceae bacterium]